MAADGGGGIVAPYLFPMLIDERGGRRNRLWGQTQPHLGADSVVSGSRFSRLWELMRPPLGADADACGLRHDCTRRAFAGKSASAFAEEKAGFVDFIFQRDV